VIFSSNHENFTVLNQIYLGSTENQQTWRREESAEKTHKPACQVATDIHSKYDERGLGLGGFVQFGHNQIKSEAALGVSVAALNGVVQAGIFVHLLAIELIRAGLINFVRQHRRRIAAKLAEIIFHSSLKIGTLIEIVPAGLLQKCVTVYHRKVQFLPKLSGIWVFCPIDRTHMRLLQTDDPVRAGVGVVVKHLLLLSIHHRDHGQTIPQPAGEPPSKVRNLVFERLQSLRRLLIVR